MPEDSRIGYSMQMSIIMSRILFELGDLAYHWGYANAYQWLMAKSSDLDKDNVIWSAVKDI